MPSLLTIIGGIFGAIASALYSYNHDSAALTFTVSMVLLFCIAAFLRFKSIKGAHRKERKILLNSALNIIDARTRLTVDLVDKFRDDVKRYRYALAENQHEYISHLLSAVGDVRINDEELKSETLSKEGRSALVADRRKLLNNIEKARSVIESYLNENT